jgi:hypothetical protein
MKTKIELIKCPTGHKVVRANASGIVQFNFRSLPEAEKMIQSLTKIWETDHEVVLMHREEDF